MLIRQLTPALLLALASLSVPATALIANAAGGLTYCKEDIARLCPGVPPGGGRIIDCLKQHEMEMSVGCAKALKAIKAKMSQ